MSNVSSLSLKYEAVSQKVNVCFTAVKQVLKGLVLRFFKGEKALRELTEERVQKLSTIEIRFLTVKQLNAIGIARFSVGQIKSLPSDFFLKFKKLDEKVVSCLTPTQLDSYFSKRDNDVKTFSHQVTPVQLKQMKHSTATKVVAYLSLDERKNLWNDEDDDVKPLIYDPVTHEKEALELPINKLANFLVALEAEATVSLLKKIDSKKLSELLQHVYAEESPQELKKIGDLFLENEECLKQHLSSLTPECLIILVEKLNKVSLKVTISFPDTLRLHLLDHLLGKSDVNLDECLEIYSDDLFKTYLKQPANDKIAQDKQVKCLTALINSNRNECLKARFNSSPNPLEELTKLPPLSPDQVRLYWDDFTGQKPVVYNAELAKYSKNVLRSYLFIEKRNAERIGYLSRLLYNKFLEILPMVGSIELGNKSLQKEQINDLHLEDYVNAICKEENSQKVEQLKSIGAIYPLTIRIAMSESLTEKEQNELLPTLFKSKKETKECVLAVRQASYMTNTSFEERIKSLADCSDRLGDLLRTLINEGFTGFSQISSVILKSYIDKQSFVHGVKNTLTKDLETLQSSLAHLVGQEVQSDKLVNAYQASYKVKSFKALLLVLDQKSHDHMDFGVIDRMDDFLKDKIDVAKETFENDTADGNVFAYFGGSQDTILTKLNLAFVKDLKGLILKNGTTVYCDGSHRDATLFRFKQYLKENDSQ